MRILNTRLTNTLYPYGHDCRRLSLVCVGGRFCGGNEWMEHSLAFPSCFLSNNPCSKLFRNFKSRQWIGIFVSSGNENSLRTQFIKQDNVCFCLGSCCPCLLVPQRPRWPPLSQDTEPGCKWRLASQGHIHSKGKCFLWARACFWGISSFLKSQWNAHAFSGSHPLSQSHELQTKGTQDPSAVNFDPVVTYVTYKLHV